LMVDWMAGIRSGQPKLAVRAHVGLSDQLVEELRTGTLDVALLYAPRLLHGFEVELLIEEELVFVRRPGEPGAGEYVHVDWGPAFAASHGGAGEAGTYVG